MRVWLLASLLLPPSVADGASARAQDVLVLEAEDFDGPWRRQTNIAGFGGDGFRTSNAEGIAASNLRGQLVIEVAGEHAVWVRAYTGSTRTPDYDERALQVAVDGRRLAVTHRGAEPRWSWERAGVVALEAGPVALTLHDADVGYEAADAVLLTRDLELDARALDELMDPDALRVLGRESSGALHAFLLAESRTLDERRLRAAEQALASEATLDAHRAALQGRYRALLGSLPERTPLDARVTGVLACDGYRIEKVAYASRPRHHVTANLYVPAGPGPFPGVLVACGHSDNGKAYEAYQRVCILLARSGFLTLIYDPICQGERHQLDVPRHGTSTHEKLSYGALLVGSSVVAHELWDGVRSLDYLQSRPELDASAPLGMTGNSGGGTQTTFLMALDERIHVAAPSCFVMTRQRLFETIGPQDGCQHLPGEGAAGLDHSDYVVMRAPRPTLILAAEHDFFEFAATRTAYERARAAYERLGRGERVALFAHTDEHGFSRPRREAAAGWMRRWILDDATPVREAEAVLRTEAELAVTASGQVRAEFPGERGVHDLSLERAHALAPARAAFWRERSPAECLARVRALLGVVDGERATSARRTGSLQRAGYRIETWVLEPRGGIALPALRLVPDAPEAQRPATLFVSGRGMAAHVLPGGDLERLVHAGRSVLALDVRGFGELRDRGADTKFDNVDQRVAALARHVGRPLLGQRVDDVLAAFAFLLEQEDVDAGRIELVGVGQAAPVALHAAALAPTCERVVLRGGLRSFVEDIVARPASADLSGHVVPGALRWYDLPDLERLLGERCVRLAD